MSRTIHRAAAAGIAMFCSTAMLAACGANEAQSGSSEEGSGASDDEAVIALLLPESKTTRYEAFDRPLFEDKVAELCDSCTVDYYNADQNEKKQNEQITSAIGKNADVIVLDPVNGEAASAMAQTAHQSDIPLIAYDRFIEGADYYMSFDNETVGKMQAKSLVKAVGDSGDILMLNGAPSDPNAAQFKAGAHSVLDKSDVNILAEFDNPDWSPQKAQEWTTDQLAKYEPKDIDGVYAANDGQAGGVISALTGAGLSPDALPPVTGQDAQLAAIQRIVAGEQSMTIYKPIKIEAETAAETAVDIAQGKDVSAPDEYQDIASFIFDPIVVTQDNVMDTLVADGFYSVDEICTDEYADACAEAGVK